MSKEKDLKKKAKKQDCGCGHSECDCGDDCKCTPENHWGCGGHCNEEKDKHDDCGCNHKDCDCVDDCKCTPEDNCGCGGHCDDSHEHDCDCGCEHEFKDRAEEFKAYQKAFDQFEEALIKVDAELEKEKARAEKNEKLADSYKKDLDRYKERNKDIVKESRREASVKVAEKILPILDNFDQALKMVKDENVMVGFKMIKSGITNILHDMDIVEIEAEGCEFNPEFHEAVHMVQAEDKTKAGQVASVFKKGYMLSDASKIIRHAQVEIYN